MVTIPLRAWCDSLAMHDWRSGRVVTASWSMPSSPSRVNTFHRFAAITAIPAKSAVCFIALTMMRLIQRKTKASLGAEFGKDLDWTYGLPGARVAKALADWQVDELPGDYYRMQNVDGDDIGLLLKAFGLEIPAKIYTNGDIRELKSAVNPF